MKIPGDQHWLRVEELSRMLSILPADQIAAQISSLAANGESPTVLTLVGAWLDLPPPPSTFEAGASIGGRYTLREKLGQGGMGTVWRARQELVGRDVALKMIHPELVTPNLRSRFLAEIETLGRLNHPAIARIFDAGFQDQPQGPPVPFFAMELVEGLPLDRWAARQRQHHQALLRTFSAICAGIQSAHEHRIVHRDIKPSNILVRSDDQPVIVDFGIARLAGVIIGEQHGLFSGTFAYAAPEQHLGSDGDFRTGESVDVYALGAILFEMFAGRRVFNFPRGASLAEMRRIVLEEQPPRLSEILPSCPPVLDEVVSRALRRDPADRFYSVVALGRAISHAATSTTPAAPSPAWNPAVNKFVPGTQWQLVEKLGEGGTGQVWSGRHDELGESRVFKFCNTEDKVRTLKRELTLYHLLKGQVGLNPHFIPLHEVSLDEPPWYLMMDHVDALELEVWVEKQGGGLANLPETVRLEIIAQAAEALQAAHEAGILHRDIKPANLLIRGRPEPGEIHVFVTDFGIGQIILEELLRKNTRSGFTNTVSGLGNDPRSGTLLYLAPEVLEGQTATVRSDIYSLGVVFWQMMIGNLHAALDATDWQSRIDDPLLREDLARCLAGAPEKRWSSAGELAGRLRSLPARRHAVARRQAELAAREKAAYRRGALKTAAIGLVLMAIFVTVAALAWVQSVDAKRAHGELVLRQAMTLNQTDYASGRKTRGINLLEIAAKTETNVAALRTAAATVFGMADLTPIPAEKNTAEAGIAPAIPRQPHELTRTASGDGALVAIARDLDGLNGAIDLFRPGGEHVRTIERKEFPWVPLAERETFCFSPNGQYLAVGGAATSRQVLICDVADASVKMYLFHGSDPLCCAWHSGGRFIAVGCADDAVRIWDTADPVTPGQTTAAKNQFDLPPTLDLPAEDRPLHILRGHRGPVTHVAFSPSGRWLAALDSGGYLRVYNCFYSQAIPANHESVRNDEEVAERDPTAPVFASEVRLDDIENVTSLKTKEDRVLIGRVDGTAQEFKFVPGELPAEIFVPPGVVSIAWDAKGTEICTTTLTDIQWLHTRPLELYQTAAGANPAGVSSEQTDGTWAVVKDDKLTEWEPSKNKTLEVVSQFTLRQALSGGAVRADLSTAGDGRTAVYYGKRIQFFQHHQPAPLEVSLVADGGGGSFKDIFWDRPGRLLGVSFVLPSGDLRLETWETSTDFPPRCHAFAPIVLNGESVMPANDGHHLIVRGRQRGLWQLDPAHPGVGNNLDTSRFARQNAPFVCTSDGKLVAMVVDQATIRLLALPSGSFFADLPNPRQSGLTALAWDPSGTHLASLTDEGFIQVWNLSAWQEWLAAHKLQR